MASRQEEILARMERLIESFTAAAMQKKRFRRAIRQFREASGLKPRDFAARLGRTHQNIYQWEKTGIEDPEAAREICSLLRTKILHQPSEEAPIPPLPGGEAGHPEVPIRISLSFELPAEEIPEFVDRARKLARRLGGKMVA